MIVVSSSMPKSGSTWFSMMLREIFILTGQGDTPDVLKSYSVSVSIVPEKARAPVRVNLSLDKLCTHTFNADPLNRERLSCMLAPHNDGKSFVLKSHSAPTDALLTLASKGICRISYLYRNPYDAALACFDRGADLRNRNTMHSNPYYKQDTHEKSAQFIHRYIKDTLAWKKADLALLLRYDELLMDTAGTLRKALDYYRLPFKVSDETINTVVRKFSRETKDVEIQEKMRLNKGVMGRAKRELSDKNKRIFDELFEEHMDALGYKSQKIN